MCDSIRLNNGQSVGTVKEFQNYFKVNAKEYGYTGGDEFLNCCLCELDLEKFFKDNKMFYYDIGDWWEIETENERHR